MTNHTMDNGAKIWMWKYCKKNHWRVAAWVDFDDLIQEGYFAYYDTLRRYPTAIEPQHIMSLFKLVLRSRIEDMVRKNSKQVDAARSDIIEVYEGDAIVLFDSFVLQSLLTKAPQVIKDVLSLFADDKQREELAKPFVKYDNGRRESLNDRVCQLLGRDNNKDLVGQLKTYFS
jgi:DNA-directed RNA polymerase specialized sigma24 family protein